MLFDVRVLTRGEWAVASVVGDIDLANLPTLTSKLASAQQTQLAIDLSGVDLLDPIASGVFVAAARRTRRDGGRLVVICPPGRPRELLAETRLDQIIDVVDRFEDLESQSE